MTDRSRRRAAPGLLALALLAFGGCGRHHRHELREGVEPPLTDGEAEPKPARINNAESPAVLHWAGGDQ